MQARSLQEAVDGLAALKAEHRPLVAQIARDAGMAPETREMLLLHLNEEEEERLGQLQTLTTGPAAAPTGGGTAAHEHPTRLTVGSLRAEAPLPVGGRVGSLRNH